MSPAPSLSAGILIPGDNEVIRAQGSALPNALLEVDNQTSLGRKMRIAGKNPTAMLPGTKGIAAEPAPQGGASELREKALRDHMLADSSDREPGQGYAEATRQRTGECPYLDDETEGKSGLAPASRLAHKAGQAVQAKMVYAIC